MTGDDSHHTGPVVDPAGLCESGWIGPRTRIGAFARVLDGAVVGADCAVGDHAFVDHAVLVGDRVTIGARVRMAGQVTVESDVVVGTGVVFANGVRPGKCPGPGSGLFVSTIVHRGATVSADSVVMSGVSIGAGSFVGPGSVVTRDVADHALVTGSPAVRVGWVCRCGMRLWDGLVCGCGRSWTAGDDRLVERRDGPAR